MLLTFVAPIVGHTYAGRPLRGLVAWAVSIGVGMGMLHASMVLTMDSRHVGFIPRARLTGRPDWVYFSRDAGTGETRWDRVGREVR